VRTTLALVLPEYASGASLLPLIVDLFTATSQSHVAIAISDTLRKAAINQQLS
jgi:hypothetical protein